MRDRKDVAGFIEGFSGTNRYILDYLLEEVLASQPPEIQRFLLYTSILERLTAPLCDAVVATSEGSESDGARPDGLESLFPGHPAPPWTTWNGQISSWCPWMMSGSGTAITTCSPTYSEHNSRSRLEHQASLNYTSALPNGMHRMALYWKRFIMHPWPGTMRGLSV
jgi:hypothetical protein